MANIKNSSPVASGPNKRRPLNLLIYAVVVLLVVGGAWLFWKNHNKSNDSEAQRAAPLIQQFLDTHDYSSYQLQLSTYANDDITNKNYKNAKKLLSEITANVPADKINSHTYRTYWYLYQQTGDSANRKKYALLTADALKKEGQSQAAGAFETDANGK